MDLNDLGTEFHNPPLRRSDLTVDPHRQFEHWMAHAVEAEVTEPNAMTLSTVGRTGQPSARIVYLKAMDPQGFVFFTNYRSRKARDLAHTSEAALTFYWPELDRQIRVEGTVEQTTTQESDGYFASRSRTSQWGAWASEQSEGVASRDALEQQFAAVQERFPNNVPRPSHWGGYRLIAHTIEFWQGRMHRCHDRFVYRRTSDGWTIERLSP